MPVPLQNPHSGSMKTGLLLWPEIRKHSLLNSKVRYVLSMCYLVGPSDSPCFWANRKKSLPCIRTRRFQRQRIKLRAGHQAQAPPQCLLLVTCHFHPLPLPMVLCVSGTGEFPIMHWHSAGCGRDWPAPGDRSSSLPGNRASSETLGCL